MTITTADVTVTSGIGIEAYGADTTTNMTIDTAAGAISSSTYGISAGHLGTGFLSITTADVTATSGTGIYAYGGSTTTYHKD